MAIKFVVQSPSAQKIKTPRKTKEPSKAHPYVQERRKRQIVHTEAELFGSKLFEPIMQREREIVVTFPHIFMYDRTRISLCGRFAYRYKLVEGDSIFTLFFIENPIDEMKPTNENFDILKKLEVVYENKFILFENLTAKEFEDAVRKLCSITINILRGEIRNDRDRIVQEILDKNKKEQDDKREKEDLADIIEDELPKLEAKISAIKQEVKVIPKENIIQRNPLLFRKVENINE